MIFDQPPAELPVATLRPRDSSVQLSLDARNWVAARWRWLQPRTIPVFVAFLGMLAVIGAANYLHTYVPEPPERVTAQPLELHVASNEPTTTATRPQLVVESEPPAAITVIDIAPGVYTIRIDAK